jgi:hypothetical protein
MVKVTAAAASRGCRILLSGILQLLVVDGWCHVLHLPARPCAEGKAIDQRQIVQYNRRGDRECFVSGGAGREKKAEKKRDGPRLFF